MTGRGKGVKGKRKLSPRRSVRHVSSSRRDRQVTTTATDGGQQGSTIAEVHQTRDAGGEPSTDNNAGNTVAVVGATTGAEVTKAITSGVAYIGTIIQGNVIHNGKEETSTKKHASDGKGNSTDPEDSLIHSRRNLEAKDKNSLTSSELNEEWEDSLGLPPLPEGKSYHAFFSHSSENTEWVEDVITYLESQELGFRCVHHQRDFHAGVRIMDNISHFVSLSWKYVLILTPAFIRSSWCKFERDVMMKLTTDERQDRIVPVLLETCDIPLSLSIITYVDTRSDKKWKDKLVRALRRPDSLLKNTTRSLGELPEDSMDKERFLQELLMKEDDFEATVADHKEETSNNEIKRRISLAQVSNKFKFIKEQMACLLVAMEQDELNTVGEKFDERYQDLLTLKHSSKYLKTLGADNISVEYKKAVERYDQWKYIRSKSRDSIFQFVVADKAVENMEVGLKKIRFGKLEQKYLPALNTEKDREQYLKDISPSSAIFSKSGQYMNSAIWCIQCPYFEFDPETLWPNRTILPDGSLCNRPPTTQHLPLDKRLKEYYGAVATTTLTANGVYYWENMVDVDMEKELGGRQLVFEVTLSTRGVFDDDASAVIKPGMLTACVFRCSEHDTDSVCMEVFKEGIPFHHYTLLQNRPGQWPTLVFGFLLDTSRHSWTVYDIVKKRKVTTVTGIFDVAQFTPQVGVHSQHAGTVKVHLITGKDLHIPGDTYELLEKALVE